MAAGLSTSPRPRAPTTIESHQSKAQIAENRRTAIRDQWQWEADYRWTVMQAVETCERSARASWALRMRIADRVGWNCEQELSSWSGAGHESVRQANSGTIFLFCGRDSCTNRLRGNLWMAKRVIVDENAGPGTKLWEQFQRTAGDEQYDYLLLAKSHRGIPDVEILDKLLQPGVILLTGDCVLHTRALAAGYRSYTLNEQGQLTGKTRSHVQVKKPLPKSIHANLQDDYAPNREHDFTRRLTYGFTDRQFKRYRTARRRIRSHFGSASAMSQVSVTVGSLPTPRGLLCGCVFHVAGTSGVKGIRASEAYCLSQASAWMDAAIPLLHALRSQYLLHLDQVRSEFFIIPAPSLQLSRQLLEGPAPASEPAARTARELMRGIKQLNLHACEKGSFHDAMKAKLAQLSRAHSNEVISLNFEKIAVEFLEVPSPTAESAQDAPTRTGERRS